LGAQRSSRIRYDLAVQTRHDLHWGNGAKQMWCATYIPRECLQTVPGCRRVVVSTGIGCNYNMDRVRMRTLQEGTKTETKRRLPPHKQNLKH
jgi:hypothetical protein